MRFVGGEKSLREKGMRCLKWCSPQTTYQHVVVFSLPLLQAHHCLWSWKSTLLYYFLHIFAYFPYIFYTFPSPSFPCQYCSDASLARYILLYPYFTSLHALQYKSYHYWSPARKLNEKRKMQNSNSMQNLINSMQIASHNASTSKRKTRNGIQDFNREVNLDFLWYVFACSAWVALFVYPLLSSHLLFSPVCFEILEEAHVTKCGHTFW